MSPSLKQGHRGPGGGPGGLAAGGTGHHHHPRPASEQAGVEPLLWQPKAHLTCYLRVSQAQVRLTETSC